MLILFDKDIKLEYYYSNQYRYSIEHSKVRV